jgi:hypothetical protein
VRRETERPRKMRHPARERGRSVDRDGQTGSAHRPLCRFAGTVDLVSLRREVRR